MSGRRQSALLVAGLLAGCALSGVRGRLEEPWPQRLGEWRLFVGRPAELRPNEGVLPYDVEVALFSDHALKHRTLWMPRGRRAAFRQSGPLEFPVGTVFSKTFYYFRDEDGVRSSLEGGRPADGLPGRPEDRRLIETRLLVRTETDWVALPYVWNEEQTEATLEVAGDEKALVWRDGDGQAQSFVYLVPNTDQCAGCHETLTATGRRLRPIGPTARNLNHDYPYPGGRANQLARWREASYLDGGPDPAAAPRWPRAEGAAGGASRARAYLDVQCAHCHGRGGPAGSSGLYLDFEEQAPERLGICKTPVAAGRGSGGLSYDIVPGRPAQSILFHRMASREPDVMMPEVGRNLRDEGGLDLVRRWIEDLPGSCGTSTPAGR